MPTADRSGQGNEKLKNIIINNYDTKLSVGVTDFRVREATSGAIFFSVTTTQCSHTPVDGALRAKFREHRLQTQRNVLRKGEKKFSRLRHTSLWAPFGENQVSFDYNVYKRQVGVSLTSQWEDLTTPTRFPNAYWDLDEKKILCSWLVIWKVVPMKKVGNCEIEIKFVTTLIDQKLD